LPDDGKPAHFAFTVHNFLIGENGAELLAPPDRRFSDIGKSVRIYELVAPDRISKLSRLLFCYNALM